MCAVASYNRNPAVIFRDDLKVLFDALKRSHYRIIGPTRRNHAIVYDDIESINDLPIGWSDEQDGGKYRLVKDTRPAFFDYVGGQYSWKKFLHVPVRVISRSVKKGKGFEIMPAEEETAKLAFIGVRSCELHAIAIQDKILTDGPYADAGYRTARDNLFVVAVNCVNPGGTCFCDSMKTGPKVVDGFDLALTEVIEDKKHYFVVEVGSSAGNKILEKIPNHPASAPEVDAADRAVARAARHMGRKLKTSGLKQLLERNFDNPCWDKVAERCLTCGNCTLVCPTCFCTNIEDETDLAGDTTLRRRAWDSCFTVGFSYIHGGSIRNSEMSRYRQWMMHKLCYWVDQFGSFGCVGCGRCITWCPVGIDITEEASRIRESEK